MQYRFYYKGEKPKPEENKRKIREAKQKEKAKKKEMASLTSIQNTLAHTDYLSRISISVFIFLTLELLIIQYKESGLSLNSILQIVIPNYIINLVGALLVVVLPLLAAYFSYLYLGRHA